MDFSDYERLGVAVRFDDKGGGNLPNANGPSWTNDGAADAPYTLSAVSSGRVAGVGRGAVTVHRGWTASTVFPGTTRDWWVYRSAQLHGGVEGDCNLIVFQDGQGYLDEDGDVRAAVLLDNLVHAGQLPPMVAVFINPGQHPDNAGQRSFEYDTMDSAYSSFLAGEILPIVEADHRISPDPARRCLAGTSSGGICAFNAAWHRLPSARMSFCCTPLSL